MKNPSITDATTLTTEVLLELGIYVSAKDLKKQHAALSRTVRDIRGFTTGYSFIKQMGDKLSDDQIELLSTAAKLIESIGRNLEHAQEKRQRSEIAEKALQKERDRIAKELVTTAYPLPTNTAEQKIRVIQTALVHSRAGCFRPFYSAIELSMRFRNYLTAPRKQDLSCGNYWDTKIERFRSELQEEVALYLAANDGGTVQERLAKLQDDAHKLLPKVMSDAYEVETLRLWAEVLSPAKVARATQ